MSRRRLTIAVVAALIGGACGETRPDATPPETAPATGVLGTAPPATGGIPSVITLTPIMPPTGAEDPFVASPLMDQFGLAFSPRRLFVPVGAATRFTNSEGSLAHNVTVRFSDDGSRLFTGDANPGTTLEVDFPQDGGYDVTCELHPGMTAFIYATRAPHFVFADLEGAFQFPEVPAGEYTLSVWNVDATARSVQSIVVESGATKVVIGPSR